MRPDDQLPPADVEEGTPSRTSAAQPLLLWVRVKARLLWNCPRASVGKSGGLSQSAYSQQRRGQTPIVSSGNCHTLFYRNWASGERSGKHAICLQLRLMGTDTDPVVSGSRARGSCQDELESSGTTDAGSVIGSSSPKTCSARLSSRASAAPETKQATSITETAVEAQVSLMLVEAMEQKL